MNNRQLIALIVAIISIQLLVFVVFYKATMESMEHYCTDVEVQELIDSTLIDIYD